MKTMPTTAASRFAVPIFPRLFSIALIVLSLLTVSVTVQAQAATAAVGAAQDARRHVEQQTLALGKLIAQYRRADEAEQANLLNQLLELASERRQRLASLAVTDPAGALRALLPAHFRQGMPEQVTALLEQKQQRQGELEVFYEDYPDGTHKLGYRLATDAGRLMLQMATPRHSGWQSGQRVQARGWLIKQTKGPDALLLTDETNSLTLLSDSGSTSTSYSTSAGSVLPNTLGEQRTLVLLVNFQDNPLQPWTLEETRETVFGTVNGYYQENSDGQTWLAGEVYGYYTLPINATCDSWEIHVNAQQAAEADGVDLSRYNRMVYVFPPISSCGWTGKGTIGGTPSRAWVNGSLSLRTVGHELGHNLGLYHAKTLDCGAQTLGDRCISIEYGDSLDIMGKAGVTGHFNVFNKELLGWLTQSAGQLVTAETDGSYTLEPYASTPAGAAKGLKIRRGTDAVTGQPQWYYLEYRQPLGFDSFLDGKALTDGVVFHLGTEADVTSSQLLDMTPESLWYDLDDASLAGGSSYTDPDAGVTVTTEWTDGSGASVSVSYSGESCLRAKPALSLSPAESSWVAAGSTVTYTATVTNQDNAGCSATDFDLTAMVPAGWLADSTSLNLAPGASGSVALSVTSSGTAADGFYDITFRAAHVADNTQWSEASVTYVVQTPVQTCEAASPQLSLAALEAPAVEAGTPVSYSGTLTNRDGSGCEASVFDLSAIVPTGWGSAGDNVSLAPGESAPVTVTVTSDSAAVAGQYELAIEAVNRNDSVWLTDVAVTYNVTAPEPVCTQADPQVTWSGSPPEVAAGTTAPYTVTVTNQDSSGCTASDFSVAADLPSGWSASGGSLNLLPGASAEIIVNITSATEADSGTYLIGINAQSVSDSRFSGSATVSYWVSPPQNSAPVAIDDSAALPSKDAITVDVLANDRDAEGDALVVIAVTQGAQGSVQILADGTLRYTPAKNFKGSDSFSYTISDGRATSQAIVSVALSDTSGNKGAGGGKGNK